ncbi:MAG: hypothetical protein A3G34_13560 [Candidatus Lindowbacteria bacterium RIFCSPLOWO2_12_FULL_62_27]|nr:MAG: hypothetical protein A3I06_10885 [Candidatus Lindowbacteria bacterium RIFCSPLOWO2_02_FULL_62_12]OGH62609.1 MAG: hypothetical protein A3G34_13560 [Candidatus Lindowbacteria bacterium RIFCSPLOWO2_12_FULL_62_27]
MSLRSLRLELWMQSRVLINSFLSNRIVAVGLVLLLAGYVFQCSYLASGVSRRFNPGAEPLSAEILTGFETFGYFYSLFTFSLGFLIAGLTLPAWNRTRSKFFLPLSPGQLADVILFSHVAPLTMLMVFFVSPPAIAAVIGGALSAPRAAGLFLFFSMELLENIFAASILSDIILGIAITGRTRRAFLWRMGGMTACLAGAVTFLFHKLGAAAFTQPFPGAVECVFGGRIAQGLAIHLFAVGGLYYVARVLTRDITIGHWEKFVSFIQSGKPGIARNVWRAAGSALREPLRSLALREWLSLTRDTVLLPFGVGVLGGAAGVLAVLGITGGDVLRDLGRHRQFLAGLFFAESLGFYFIYLHLCFFLSTSSYGGEGRDMELLAAQPIGPDQVLRAKTAVHGAMLAAPVPVIAAFGLWLSRYQPNVPPMFVAAMAAVAIGMAMFLQWTAVCMGAILPDPRRPNRYMAINSTGLGVAFLVWLMAGASVVISVAVTRWLPGRFLHLPLVMILLWLIVGLVLHREASRAMAESHWARPARGVDL